MGVQYTRDIRHVAQTDTGQPAGIQKISSNETWTHAVVEYTYDEVCSRAIKFIGYRELNVLVLDKRYFSCVDQCWDIPIRSVLLLFVNLFRRSLHCLLHCSPAPVRIPYSIAYLFSSPNNLGVLLLGGLTYILFIGWVVVVSTVYSSGTLSHYFPPSAGVTKGKSLAMGHVGRTVNRGDR